MFSDVGSKYCIPFIDLGHTAEVTLEEVFKMSVLGMCPSGGT